MQLFDNFDIQPPDYIPNNMFPRIPEILEFINEETVHPRFNGEKLIGYWWRWGDDVSLDIINQICVGLPAGAMISWEEGEYPDEHTAGDFPGQKYYNFVDLASWTFDSIVDDDQDPENGVLYVWVKDPQLVSVKNGVERINVPVPLADGEQIVVQIFNFRKELINEWAYSEQRCTWRLTPEESKQLIPGIYYLNIYLETPYEEIQSDLRTTNCYEIYVKGF